MNAAARKRLADDFWLLAMALWTAGVIGGVVVVLILGAGGVAADVPLGLMVLGDAFGITTVLIEIAIRLDRRRARRGTR